MGFPSVIPFPSTVNKCRFILNTHKNQQSPMIFVVNTPLNKPGSGQIFYILESGIVTDFIYGYQNDGNLKLTLGFFLNATNIFIETITNHHPCIVKGVFTSG